MAALDVTTYNTTTLTPIADPDTDSALDSIVPSTGVTLFYGSADEQNSGLVNMTLSTNTVAVALEYIQSIAGVACADDSLTITFTTEDSFTSAISEWSLDETLLMITNHMGNCDTEFERGFFQVDSIQSDASTYTIVASAASANISSIAESCHLVFSDVPAATLTKRLTLDPTTSLSYSDSISNITLYELDSYLNVVADEAAFTSTVTFSGELVYNFWTFSLTSLYFDIDTAFSADLQVSAYAEASYAKSLSYAPDELVYSFLEVAGIVTIGPGIAFSIGLDFDTSAEVNVTAKGGVSIADGNVHVDLLDEDNTSTSGWTPVYTSSVDVSEGATVEADISATVEVEMVIEFLGGLVDLSTGLTATAGFDNTLTLSAAQTVDLDDGASVVSDASSCTSGVTAVSDFVFNLTAFVTSYYSVDLYDTSIELLNECYLF